MTNERKKSKGKMNEPLLVQNKFAILPDYTEEPDGPPVNKIEVLTGNRNLDQQAHKDPYWEDQGGSGRT